MNTKRNDEHERPNTVGDNDQQSMEQLLANIRAIIASGKSHAPDGDAHLSARSEQPATDPSTAAHRTYVHLNEIYSKELAKLTALELQEFERLVRRDSESSVPEPPPSTATTSSQPSFSPPTIAPRKPKNNQGPTPAMGPPARDPPDFSNLPQAVVDGLAGLSALAITPPRDAQQDMAPRSTPASTGGILPKARLREASVAVADAVENYLVAVIGLRRRLRSGLPTDLDRRDFDRILDGSASDVSEELRGRVLSRLAKESPLIPPATAPEDWTSRENKSENAAQFVRRVYARWIGKGLSRRHLRVLDPALYRALSVWVHRHPEDAIHDLPPMKEEMDEVIDSLSRQLSLEELRKLGYALDQRLRRMKKKS